MLSFKPIEITDKEIITSYTFRSHYLNCDYSFANMCSWSFLYKSEYAVADNYLIIRFFVGENGDYRRVYMQPVGEGDLPRLISLLENDASDGGFPLWILGVTPDAKNELENAAPGQFKFVHEKDFSDYIYLRTDLAELKGKKYQSKRNHINKFKSLYDYEYIPITPDLVPRCLELESLWFRANRTDNDADDLQHEKRSMVYALNHYDELGLSGGAIVVGGEIIAFTYGSPINNKAFGVHVEKADVNFEGIFSLINQEFAKRIPERYIFVNREEDLGIAGLRQAKQSYHPTILLEKYTALKKS